MMTIIYLVAVATSSFASNSNSIDRLPIIAQKEIYDTAISGNLPITNFLNKIYLIQEEKRKKQEDPLEVIEKHLGSFNSGPVVVNITGTFVKGKLTKMVLDSWFEYSIIIDFTKDRQKDRKDGL